NTTATDRVSGQPARTDQVGTTATTTGMEQRTDGAMLNRSPSRLALPRQTPQQTLSQTIGAHMNASIRSQDFTAEQERTSGPLRALLRALVAMFASPKGDQGGWEVGARGH